MSFELFALVGLLGGCAGADSADLAAIAACELLPGVVADGVGQALGRGVIDPEELALWDLGAPSPGLADIGPAGLGVIRANSTCRLDGRTPHPKGLRLALTRHEPDLDQLATWQLAAVQDLPTVPRTLQLTWVDTAEGPRIRLGLAQAIAERDAARALFEAGRPEDAIAALDALTAWFPDPLLRWQRDAWAHPPIQPSPSAEPAPAADP